MAREPAFFLLEFQERLTQPSNFDRTRWDHWLLIVCFITIAACGLWLARHWHR